MNTKYWRLRPIERRCIRRNLVQPINSLTCLAWNIFFSPFPDITQLAYQWLCIAIWCEFCYGTTITIINAIIPGWFPPSTMSWCLPRPAAFLSSCLLENKSDTLYLGWSILPIRTILLSFGVNLQIASFAVSRVAPPANQICSWLFVFFPLKKLWLLWNKHHTNEQFHNVKKSFLLQEKE